ncbi:MULTISPECIES: hypothetical protein [unclassified Micromonospora]|uniref:hypothetical protein n=1 Tax=unclassified Micromonospora TaxID=2617518 RepID=UPI003317072A
MTAEPTFAALREYNRVTAALMADPEITGNLLLLGLWLARATILKDPPEGENGWNAADAARSLFPLSSRPAMGGFGVRHEQTTGPNTWRVSGLLKEDIRRYDFRAEPGYSAQRTPCGAPTPRKLACGKPESIGSLFTDPETGRRHAVGACRQHANWYWEQQRANQEACAAVEVPQPPANTGGRLARHIRLDWQKLWSTLDPDWTPPPEVEAWERPNLRLFVSPDVPLAEVPTAVTPRPRFAVISGGAS